MGGELPGDVFGPLNAETGDLSEFDSISAPGTTVLAAAADAKIHGNYGFKVTFNGSNDEAFGALAFPEQSVFWLRFYVYVPSSFNQNDNFSTLPLINVIDGNNRVFGFGVGTEAATKTDRWYIEYRFSFTKFTTKFTTDEPHLVEIKYTKDAVNGGVEVYIDNEKVAENMGNDSSAYSPDNLEAGHPGGADIPDSGNHYYLDDIIGTTERRGAYSVPGGATQKPNAIRIGMGL